MLTRREERDLRKLRHRKVRQEEGRFLAEGVRVVEDLLASPLEVRVVVYLSSLKDNERGRQLLEHSTLRGIPAREVSATTFHNLVDTQTPQGVLAIAEVPRAQLAHLLNGPSGVALVLDAVQDPGNFGTLVRTAEALGAAGVVTLAGTVDPWNPKAVRAAAGSSFRLPIIEAGWEEAATWMRSERFHILAAAPGGEPLEGRHFDRAALVVGNEGAGISPQTRAHADAVVGIRLRGRAESLNVSAAAAILLYELLR